MPCWPHRRRCWLSTLAPNSRSWTFLKRPWPTDQRHRAAHEASAVEYQRRWSAIRTDGSDSLVRACDEQCHGRVSLQALAPCESERNTRVTRARSLHPGAPMRMRHRLPFLVILTLLAPSAAHASPINLLINGSFELGPAMNGPLCSISPSTCQDVDVLAGSTAIPGWTVFGVSVDYMGSPWDVSNGLHAIDLDGRNATFSGISQTFATTLGQTYRVSFDLSGNPQGGSPLKNVLALAGSFSQSYSFDTTGQSINALTWTPNSFIFTASGPSTTLSFVSLSATPSSYGALIDNVAVYAVPGPSTLLLLGTGVGVGIFRRKRR